jgi:hypothetical protein
MDADFCSANAAPSRFLDRALADRDSRFRLACTVNSQDPEGAVAEIEARSHPGTAPSCSVRPPRPFGKPFFYIRNRGVLRKRPGVAMLSAARAPPQPAASAPLPEQLNRASPAAPVLLHGARVELRLRGVFDKFPSLKVGCSRAASPGWRPDVEDGSRLKGLRPPDAVGGAAAERVRQRAHPLPTSQGGAGQPEALKHINDWIEAARTLCTRPTTRTGTGRPTMTLAGYPDDLRRRSSRERARTNV